MKLVARALPSAITRPRNRCGDAACSVSPRGTWQAWVLALRRAPSRNPAGARSRADSPQRGPSALRSRSAGRSEEHTSELQSLMRISYAVFCLKKKKKKNETHSDNHHTTTHIHQTKQPY